MKIKFNDALLLAIVVALMLWVTSCGGIHFGQSEFERTWDIATADGDLSDADIAALEAARERDDAKHLGPATLGKIATGDWLGAATEILLAVVGVGGALYGTHRVSRHVINKERNEQRVTLGEPVVSEKAGGPVT